MKIKKPSLKGVKNCAYLGHFAMDKYIEKGHNFSGNPGMKEDEKKREEYMNAPMAYDVAEKRRREEKLWKEAGRPAAIEAAKKLKERDKELEQKYGKEAALREVRRQAIKRRKDY